MSDRKLRRFTQFLHKNKGDTFLRWSLWSALDFVACETCKCVLQRKDAYERVEDRSASTSKEYRAYHAYYCTVHAPSHTA